VEGLYHRRVHALEEAVEHADTSALIGANTRCAL
jgi:hypothetical protein